MLLARIAAYDPECAKLLAAFAMSEKTFDYRRIERLLVEIIQDALQEFRLKRAA